MVFLNVYSNQNVIYPISTVQLFSDCLLDEVRELNNSVHVD